MDHYSHVHLLDQFATFQLDGLVCHLPNGESAEGYLYE